ncbi:hypothetical protein ACFUGD_13485 [Streptomyces sp. NPDC057217]|uniref:hypothetical protein n=1 Tax=Streptomyces sp. NPDC057217 TaxID=3346054 RepID=UPI0036455D33
MYAIKVILQPPPTPPGPPGEDGLGGLAALLSARPGRGVEHVTLRRLPWFVVAMTFVTAPHLLAAEEVARAAWTCWLESEVLRSWRLVECAGDLLLGVAAAGDEEGTAAGW